MDNNFYIVLMAGGSGTRLWPMSRCDKPKQFHNICSPKSLIQETYERIKPLTNSSNIYVSLVASVFETTKKQLNNIPNENYIIEPEVKNTAPALALAAVKLFQINPEAIIAAISCDHTVENVQHYQTAFKQALAFVQDNPDYLVTIGIEPTDPNTGYGYIKKGRKFTKTNLREVKKFIEKPDLKTAKAYLKSGQYLWNGGYFVFKASSLISMYKKYAPDIYKIIKELLKITNIDPKDKKFNNLYNKMPVTPFDIAIAEKVEHIAVVPMDCGWSDVGSWASVYEFLARKDNKQTVSQGHHIGFDDKNCLVYAQDKLLATIGLEDIVIVDTKDVTLVCKKDRSQDIKKIIEIIKTKGKHHYL